MTDTYTIMQKAITLVYADKQLKEKLLQSTLYFELFGNKLQGFTIYIGLLACNLSQCKMVGTVQRH